MLTGTSFLYNNNWVNIQWLGTTADAKWRQKTTIGFGRNKKRWYKDTEYEKNEDDYWISHRKR